MNGHTFPYVLRIATVEDSPIVADRLQTMLCDLEYIEFAGNATNISDALRLVRDEKPGVVILDIHLKENAPNNSGMDLLADLRLTYPGMVLIMLTNLSSHQYRSKCLKLGANYFFDKTNDFEKVPEILSNLLTTRELKNEA
ncbi:MAG: response regulator [Chitinophagales bacterium]|nr:response regulator [Chitinophagales bacterium]